MGFGVLKILKNAKTEYGCILFEGMVLRAAKILVDIYLLFLPLASLNSIFFRQISFRLIGHLTMVNIAPEPRGFGQENS